MSEPVISAYDAALFDLDGVVYLGPEPVPGAADGLAALREREVRIGFVTNNAARTPGAVAAHLRELGISCTDDDVVTSAQAGARLLADTFPDGGLVLVVGTDALRDQISARGFDTTTSAVDEPIAVIQGYDPQLSWATLTEAAVAVQHGATWIATNTDPTRPTERGLVPGTGAAVAVVQTCTPHAPLVAGKPHRPLMEETLRRIGGDAPIFVGDRLDTDIAGAVACEMDSMLVLTGTHGLRELLAADPSARPTHLGQDLGALLAPARIVRVDGNTARCGTATARRTGGGFEVAGDGLDAAWALTHLVWALADAGEPVDPEAALAALPS